MIKRWLITFGVAWLLGCAVTVLVAWCCTIGCTVRMNSSRGPEQPEWPMRPPSHWPETPQTVSRFTAVAWPRGLDVTTAGSTRKSLELDAEMLRIRAGWPLPALQSRVTAEYGIISSDDFTSGVRVAPHRTATRVYFAFNDTTLRLPTRILGWGFVANSTIAAILLLVPIALFRLGAPLTTRGEARLAAACWFVAIVALGTVASALVAGGLWLRWQIWASPPPLVTAHRDATGFYIGDIHSALDTAASWPATPPIGWKPAPDSWRDRGAFLGVRAGSYSNSPLDSRYFGGDINTRDRLPLAFTVSVGWPMRCLESVELMLDDGSRQPGALCFDLPILAAPAGTMQPGPVSPTRPFLLALLANTLFYAYVIALPVLSIRAVRVVRRRRRGACECCGYSRAGLAAGAACPECGAPSPAPSESIVSTANGSRRTQSLGAAENTARSSSAPHSSAPQSLAPSDPAP